VTVLGWTPTRRAISCFSSVLVATSRVICMRLPWDVRTGGHRQPSHQP
jgi:hypothetical protein